MKKHYTFFSFVAVLLVMLTVSCQKEYDTITLDAYIQPATSSDGKVYIANSTPYWHNGDLVRVNNETCTISNANNTTATITVADEADRYLAFYPASLLSGTPNLLYNSGSSDRLQTMVLPQSQPYLLDDNNRQIVKVPMGAFTEGSTSLTFTNICSIVRVSITNPNDNAISLSSIRLETPSEGSVYLSGNCYTYLNTSSIYFEGWSNSATNKYKDVTLSGDNMTVPANTTKSFDIVIPPWTTNTESPETTDVTFTITADDTRYLVGTRTSVTLPANTIATASFNLNNLHDPSGPAYLKDGPSFNALIPSGTTRIVFVYNNQTVPSGTVQRLEVDNTNVPIFGSFNSSTGVWTISTPGTSIVAHSNCSTMFCEPISSQSIETIDFGDHFDGSQVTNMESMFQRSRITTVGGSDASVNLSVFSNAHPTNMASMFANSTVSIVDLSMIDASQVTNMSQMFYASNLDSVSFGTAGSSSFSTASCTNMSEMFKFCNQLNSLDLSLFNTANVTTIAGMFMRCTRLSSITFGSNFTTAYVTDMSQLFDMEGTSTANIFLTSLDLSGFDTRRVTNMSNMFRAMTRLSTLTLSTTSNPNSFNTSAVTNMEGMFNSCLKLSRVNFYNCVIGSSTTTTNMLSHTGQYLGQNRQCVIYCPSDAATSMQATGTGYSSSYVSFVTSW